MKANSNRVRFFFANKDERFVVCFSNIQLHVKKMTRTFFIILLLGPAFHNVFAQAPNFKNQEKIAFQESKRYVQKSAFAESENYGNYDLTYQRMEWKINPAIHYIEGNITSYFKSKKAGLNEIEFDLHSALGVDSVVQNRKNLGFSRNNNKLVIKLSASLQENKIDSVTVYYQGEPADSGFGSFAQSEHNGTPIIWTLSEPYGAMEWWPCKQSLADKIDSIDVIVSSPKAYRTASNGILISDEVAGGTRTMHWKHRFPIATYLVAIAVTNYSVYSDFLDLKDNRKIEILNYVYPENLELAQSQTSATVDIMKLYNQVVGEYPFASEKYGHAQFGWSGGMEHQTMSFMGSFGFDLVAHELAHQWFGDYITVASWHDIWLNEGFATFLTGIAYENLQNGVWWPVWKKQNAKLILSKPGGSVYVQDTTNISRIFDSRLSYSKGAFLLHMLRWVLGDEAFFSGLKNYFNDPQLAGGFTRTENFVVHMEAAGDTTLTEFFNDWYFGEGFPVYSLEYQKAGNGTYKIMLGQTTSHPSVDFFEMPVPVRLYSAGKTDSIDFRLTNLENNQEFTVASGFEIADVKIDPDHRILSETNEIISASSQTAAEDIRIFPNPFTDELFISVPSGTKIVSVRIFNLQGKLLKQFNGTVIHYNLSSLPEGLYVVRVQTSSEQFEKKILKH